MKRKIFSILFALALVCSFSVVTAVPVAAGDIIVGPNIYTSIQAAIDDPLTLPGDTIIVEAATYYETIDVTKDGLIIQSLSGDPSDTIIDANGADHTVVSILSNNVTFSGFTVTGAIGLTYADYSYQGNSGVYMQDVEGCRLSNLIIDDISRDGSGWCNGIFLQRSCDNIFESIAISNIAGGTNAGQIFGIVLRGDAGGSHRNSFTDITIDTITTANPGQSSAVGIMSWGQNNDNTFDTTTITNLTAPQGACGIRGDGEGNSFTSTEISFLTAPSAYGILLEFAANNTFEGTTISNIAGSGTARGVYLRFGDCHDNSFTSTDISGLTGATTHGIYITDAYVGPQSNSFDGGSISGAQRGVYINGYCLNHSIHNTNIVGNTEYGAYSDTVILDAKNNWWGSASGPAHASNTYTAPGGAPQGNAVSDLVDFVPWLGGPYPSASIVPVSLDDPPGQFSSIGAAVIAAGGTIITCIAGTYTEDVTITISLQLLGAKVGVPAGPDASPAGRSDPLEESIIDGRIRITGAGKTIIDGFTILNEEPPHGIWLTDGGDVIKNNIIDGVDVTVDKSGIFSGGGGGYLITNNNIRNYGHFGITFDGGPADPQCTISGNYITNITGENTAGIQTQGSWSNGHIFSNNLIENCGAGMVLAQGEHQVSGNTIRNNSGSGICLFGLPRTFGIQITRNTIEGNVAGIKLVLDDSGAVNNVAHFNNIVGNADGVINNHTAAFDATFNWWGDVTGAEQATTNPDGKGNKVSDNVDYIPWLTRNFETVLTEGIGYYGYPMVELGTGWNLLSTPFALDPGETIGEVDYPGCNTWDQFVTLNELSGKLYTGGDQEYVNAYYFDGEDQVWGEVGDGYILLPCDAIYVRMASPDIAAVLASPQRWMPTKTLYKDWNLVGLSWMIPGGQDVPAKLALNTVEEVGSLTGYTLVVSPSTNQQPWTYVGGPAVVKYMRLTKGYWVFMENGPDDLAGSWFTPMGLP